MDSETTRRAQTRETPQATALASDVPEPLRGGAAGRDGAATPPAESRARKNPRNALKRLKTDSETGRPAQTRETPQATALASDVPEPLRGGAAGRDGAATPPAELRARKNPRNALKRLKTDSEAGRPAQTRETPQATALASDVPEPLRGGAAGRDGAATPPAELRARKNPRNALKRLKTDSETGRRAQTRETPQATALASDVPEPLRGGAAGRNGAATPPAESRARKNPCNVLKRLKTDSEMARPAQTRETPQATALASDVPEPLRGGAAGRDGAATPSAKSHARETPRNALKRLKMDSGMTRRARDQPEVAGRGPRRPATRPDTAWPQSRRVGELRRLANGAASP